MRQLGVLCYDFVPVELPPSGVIRLPKQVVNADMIKVSKFDKDIRGKLLSPGFEIAVFSLRNTDGIRDLLLRKIVIFTQIPDSVAHTVDRLIYDAFIVI